MKTLSKEEIIMKVNAAHPGTQKTITFIEGAPIHIDENNTLYIVKKMKVRFKLAYQNQPTVKWTKQICEADDAAKVAEAALNYEAFSAAKKAVIPKRYLTMLKTKTDLASAGLPIPKYDRIFVPRVYDSEHNFIVICDNGNTLLTCYAAFAKNIHTKKDWETKTQYLIENKKTGKITEVSPVTLEIAAALKKAEKVARSSAGKPATSAPSLVYTVALKNIISIE